MTEQELKMEQIGLLSKNQVSALTAHLAEVRTDKQIMSQDEAQHLREKIRREFYEQLASLTPADLITLARDPALTGLCIGLTETGQHFEILRVVQPEFPTINERLTKSLDLRRSTRDLLFSLTTPRRLWGPLITQADVQPQVSETPAQISAYAPTQPQLESA